MIQIVLFMDLIKHNYNIKLINYILQKNNINHMVDHYLA